jgi:hypothetical protein
MSRTIKFAKAGGPEVLDFVEVQVPAPRSERGPHQGQGDRHQPRRSHVTIAYQSPVGSQESRRTDFCPYQHEVISPIET